MSVSVKYDWAAVCCDGASALTMDRKEFKHIAVSLDDNRTFRLTFLSELGGFSEVCILHLQSHKLA